MTRFMLNGNEVEATLPGDTPLLWVIRDEMGLTGTKFGCGIAQCGACTVHQDGAAIRSCVTPVEAVAGSRITTIEGLSKAGDHPLQTAWIEEQVPQCGYCQSGQIMQAASFLKDNPNPSDAEVVEAMRGNLCRCMSYSRIKKAVLKAANALNQETVNG